MASLSSSNLPASRLELEITETVLLDNNEEHLAVLHEIKTLGVSIVLDFPGMQPPQELAHASFVRQRSVAVGGPPLQVAGQADRRQRSEPPRCVAASV